MGGLRDMTEHAIAHCYDDAAYAPSLPACLLADLLCCVKLVHECCGLSTPSCVPLCVCACLCAGTSCSRLAACGKTRQVIVGTGEPRHSSTPTRQGAATHSRAVPKTGHAVCTSHRHTRIPTSLTRKVNLGLTPPPRPHGGRGTGAEEQRRRGHLDPRRGGQESNPWHGRHGTTTRAEPSGPSVCIRSLGTRAVYPTLGWAEMWSHWSSACEMPPCPFCVPVAVGRSLLLGGHEEMILPPRGRPCHPR